MEDGMSDSESPPDFRSPFTDASDVITAAYTVVGKVLARNAGAPVDVQDLASTCGMSTEDVVVISVHLAARGEPVIFCYEDGMPTLPYEIEEDPDNWVSDWPLRRDNLSICLTNNACDLRESMQIVSRMIGLYQKFHTELLDRQWAYTDPEKPWELVCGDIAEVERRIGYHVTLLRGLQRALADLNGEVQSEGPCPPAPSLN